MMDTTDIEFGEGKIVDEDGKKVAVYKDENGNVKVMLAVCTHKGCVVKWNGQEKTWDCPCHGSRYSANGKVVSGPATKDLNNY